METKISMKTIYLILVITIGLVGLGIGSTLAVFTASAEISNPISFSSNLSYNGDVFDTVEVTIGPNATRTTNVSIFNDQQIDGVKYAVWYIYEGDDGDVSFEENQESDIDPSGSNIGQGGTLGLDIKNNTSNTITITIGVTTSKDDIVLPSYMKLITISEPTTYNLKITKDNTVDKIYYKVGSASGYTVSSSDVTVPVEVGATYSYYVTAKSGYVPKSCTVSGPCSGTMGTSDVVISVSASANKYSLAINKGTGVSTIYYRLSTASSYTSSTSSVAISAEYNKTYYYYGTASTGYTMSSCTSSSPCSVTIPASAVTRSLTATANTYNLTLTKGTGVGTIYYKVNGASSYLSTTSTKTISVNYGTTYYYYGTASTGYTMGSCTSASPCSGTMGTSAVSKSLSATINKVIVKLSVNGGVLFSGSSFSVSNGIISINGSDTIASFDYGGGYASTGTGLPDYNNSSWINVTKPAATASSGAEWKCLSGNCTLSAYNQATNYTAAQFCNAASSSCTVTLGVNWVSSPTGTFYPNGGVFSTGAATYSLPVTIGTKTYFSNLPFLSQLSRDSCTLDGWYQDAPSGTVYRQYFNLESGDTNVNYYAHWNCCSSGSVTYTFYSNGGKFSDGNTMKTVCATSGSNYYLSNAPAPTRSGCTLNGWHWGSTSGTIYKNYVYSSADVDFYANWSC